MSSDPVPGDPSTVAAGGRDYLDVADAIGSAKNTLHTIDLGDFVVSEAVDALQDTAHKVADSIGKAEARYRAAGEALIAYAPVLEQAQTDSASALALARSATEAADGADQQRRHYLHLSTTESDPAQALQYKNLADTSESDAADAQRTLTAAQDQLSQATSARDRAAESAIDGIHAITEHDGLHDSWWDNWGKNLVEAITDIAGWVSSIAGVLALCVCWIPVVGQALAAALLIVAGVAAIVNAIGNVVLAATGDRSWTTALISIAGAVLAVVGLGGAVRVVGNVAAAARINAMKWARRMRRDSRRPRPSGCARRCWRNPRSSGRSRSRPSRRTPRFIACTAGRERTQPRRRALPTAPWTRGPSRTRGRCWGFPTRTPPIALSSAR